MALLNRTMRSTSPPSINGSTINGKIVENGGSSSSTSSNEEERLAARPGFGTKGQVGRVLTNTYELVLPKTAKMVYQYSINIFPKMPPGKKRPMRLNRAIWSALVSQHNPFTGVSVVWDGVGLAYSPVKLPHDVGCWTVTLDSGSLKKSDVFQIGIKFGRPVDLEALKVFVKGGTEADAITEGDVMSAVQALNVAVQHGPMQANPSRGASFFLPGDNPQAARGFEMWRGYYSSIRPGIGRALVNVDLTSIPMLQRGNLPDVLLELIKLDTKSISKGNLAFIPPAVAIKLSRMLKNVRIVRTFPEKEGPPQKRRIRSLSPKNARLSKFKTEDGREMSVENYFLETYNVHLQHPDWPCVLVSKVAWWPIEVCQVELGQKFLETLTPEQVVQVLKFTTLRPRDRLRMVCEGVDHIFPRNDQAFQQWDIQASRKPLEITARILPAPLVQYQKQSVAPKNGEWDMRGKTFSTPSSIERWAVFVLDSWDRIAAENAVMKLGSQLKTMGVTVANPHPSIFFAPPGIPPSDVDAFIRFSLKPPGMTVEEFKAPQLLVCFVASRPSPLYPPIKRFGDMTVGVATQCLLIERAAKGGPAYWQNVALKVNVKLGGINATAKLGKTVEVPTVVFGLDLSHPKPGSLAPSVVGVVASMNESITKFGSRISVQAGRSELILDLEQLVHSLLMQFKEGSPFKPERIIVFRDGVSEGRFLQVLDFEVKAIRIACQRIEPDFKPSITFIVCGKRHHITLFPAEPSMSDNKTGNVKAGTIVDTGIVSPFHFDWYSQSHGSILGTSRSCHYTVLCDESRFSADDLQELCNSICYVYQRCARSVSYATPAYYADRLCTRATVLLGLSNAAGGSSEGGSGGSGESAQELMERAQERLKEIHPFHAQSLFFL
ncbi:hypothetical protein JCM6882_006321 [Rhodosporidiobolus microsporus]